MIAAAFGPWYLREIPEIERTVSRGGSTYTMNTSRIEIAAEPPISQPLGVGRVKRGGMTGVIT